MADDIYSNMSNMSVDELGSSLLQKKDASDRAAAKRAKKNEKIQQGLALLLMGQGVMKNQFKKRASELKEDYTFNKIGNAVKAQQMAASSSIINTIGVNWDGTGGLQGFQESDDYSNFKSKVVPILDNHFKATMGMEFDEAYNKGTYNNAIDGAVAAYAEHYIGTEKGSEVPRYIAYENSLRKIFAGDAPTDMERADVLKLGMGLDETKLTSYQRNNYKKILEDYKSQGNIIGGFKRILNIFGNKTKSNGGPDIMKRIDDNVLLGGTIADMSRSMDLKGLTNSIADREFAKASKSGSRWLEIATSPSNDKFRKRILEEHLPSMKKLIKSGRYPSSLEQSINTSITQDDYEDFLNDLNTSQRADDRVKFVNHTGALAIRMEKDTAFLKRMWKATSADEMDWDSFKNIMEEEENRTYFAAMQMLGEGFIDSKKLGFRNKNKKGYDSFGTLKTVFNKFAVRNQVNGGILINEQGIEIGNDYIDYTPKEKKEEIKDTINFIIKNNLTNENKRIIFLNQLKPYIEKEFNMDVDDLVEIVAQEQLVEREKNKPGFILTDSDDFKLTIEDQMEDINSSKKKTKVSSNYDAPEYNKLLNLHFNRLGIDGKEIATQNLNELASFILEAESDGNFNAANPDSSARGGYQFLKDSVDPAVVRLEKYLGPLPRFDEVRKTGDVRSLSPEDQTLLFMADILEKTAVVKGVETPGYGDKLITTFLNADSKKDKQKAAYEIYAVLHHTTDKKGNIPLRAKLQTKIKLRKYFNE